jgi:hypothetical protein
MKKITTMTIAITISEGRRGKSPDITIPRRDSVINTKKMMIPIAGFTMRAIFAFG